VTAESRPASASTTPAPPEPTSPAEREPEPAAASTPPPAPTPAAEPAAIPPAQAESAEDQSNRQRAGSKKGPKGRRSSVPSWDEIMLGSSRQRD
jgi:hypothetical protein